MGTGPNMLSAEHVLRFAQQQAAQVLYACPYMPINEHLSVN